MGDIMTRTIILLPFVLLAACGSKGEVKATNASVEEVANKVAAAQSSGNFLHAGKWSIKGSVVEVSMPGMPAAMAEQMKQRSQAMSATEQCMTEEQVRKPGPGFFTAVKNCRYDHFTMSGGKIDAKMNCTSPQGVQSATMIGDYTPETYRMDMVTSMKVEGSPGMTMKLHAEGKRIGECDAATAGKVAAQ